MIVSLIVAVSDNQVIGIDNQLPWHLPVDLKYFKQLTTGHTIIMGRKTYASIGRPLPNRENIVITRNEEAVIDGVVVKHSIESALAHCQDKEEVFVIGGDTIYHQTLDIADKIYLTRVHTTLTQGTAFFPVLDSQIWECIHQQFQAKDEKNPLDCTFELYQRRTS